MKSKTIPISVAIIIVAISSLIYLKNREPSPIKKNQANIEHRSHNTDLGLTNIEGDNTSPPSKLQAPTTPFATLDSGETDSGEANSDRSNNGDGFFSNSEHLPEGYLDGPLSFVQDEEQWRDLVTSSLNQYTASTGKPPLDGRTVDRIVSSLSNLVNATIKMSMNAAENDVPIPADFTQIEEYMELDRLFKRELGVDIYGFLEGLSDNPEYNSAAPLKSDR